jgi:hypothetical protein
LNDTGDSSLRDFIKIGDEQNINTSSLPWHMWGGLAWTFSDSAFTNPFAPHPRGRANFMVTISLRSNAQGNSFPALTTNRADYMGDSELLLPEKEEERALVFRFPEVDAACAVLQLLENPDGRLGALGVVVFDTPRLLDAYRTAQMAFNRFAIGVAVRREIPIRKLATLIERIEGDHVSECAIVSPVGYPLTRCEATLVYPEPLQRLFSNYAEAVRSTSPFYSFLCLFAIVEFVMREQREYRPRVP